MNKIKLSTGNYSLIIIFILLVSCFISSTFAASDNLKNSFQYMSPLPGSELVSRETNIILRQGEMLSCAAAALINLVSINGSLSGNHSYKVVISDDNRTIILTPDTPFQPGEQVIVNLNKSVSTASGRLTETGSYYFTISPKIAELLTEEERFEIAYEGMLDSRLLHRDSDNNGDLPVTNDDESLPADFPGLNVSVNSNPDDGYVFIARHRPVGSAYMMILDNSGYPVFYKKHYSVITDFKVQLDTLISYYGYGSGGFTIMDTTYTVVDTYTCGNGYTADHHEFQLLPDGHAIMIAYDAQIIDMSEIVEGGDPDCRVTGLIIQELDLDKNVVFQWRSWDYIPITDVTHANMQSSRIDYVHGNAVDLDSDGNYLVSCRHLDAILKINRQTGDVIWYLGGNNNMFEFVSDTSGFNRQHDIRLTDSGTITIFDNGNWHTPQFSRAVEYQLDTINMTCELVWEYRYSPDLWSGVNGSVQRLPNGNTMIGWGGPSDITLTEVSSDNIKQFELSYDNAPDYWSYRSFRFPWSGTALIPNLIVEETADERIKLIFNKFGDSNISKYYIYADTDPEPTTIVDSTEANYFYADNLLPERTYYARVTAVDNSGNQSEFSDEVDFITPGVSYLYLCGDANMASESWPPIRVGGDVTYLINYFRGLAEACLLEGFFCSADCNGDCLVVGSDVTYLVNYFRGLNNMSYCPDYYPAWLTADECPENAPEDWPGCGE